MSKICPDSLVRWQPRAALIALVLGFGSIIHFHMLCGWGSTVGWCPARDYFALGISYLWIATAFTSESTMRLSKKSFALCGLSPFCFLDCHKKLGDSVRSDLVVYSCLKPVNVEKVSTGCYIQS